MISLNSITAILGILIPIIIAYISTRHNFRKHPRQEFSEDIESAKEFEATLNSNDSQLIKDRIAQKLVVKKNINFLEVNFFHKYVDMEFWLGKYIYIRNYIRPLVDENKNIIELKPKYSNKRGLLYLIFYFLFAFMALIPLMFVKFYLELWDKALATKQYLIIANLIMWPLILASLAFIYLHKANKIAETSRFLKRFKDESIKY